jgi:hypothetical protein
MLEYSNVSKKKKNQKEQETTRPVEIVLSPGHEDELEKLEAWYD